MEVVLVVTVRLYPTDFVGKKPGVLVSYTTAEADRARKVIIQGLIILALSK